MAYNGRYSIAIRILLLKKYFETNAGRNRYVKPQEIHDFLKEYELDVEKKALYADFAVLGDIFGLQLEYDPHKKRQMNISELARVCDISRTTAYKYKSLLEA